MKKVYVAGAYSANNVLDVLHNIRKGIQLSATVFKAGYAPFSPWLDYHFVLEDDNRELTVSHFYDYSMEFLKVCDAVLLVPGWEDSNGTKKEIEMANQMEIPIFERLRDLEKHF